MESSRNVFERFEEEGDVVASFRVNNVKIYRFWGSCSVFGWESHMILDSILE